MQSGREDTLEERYAIKFRHKNIWNAFDCFWASCMNRASVSEWHKRFNNVEFLREFRKRFLGKRPGLFKSGQWHFHQDNAPIHNSFLVTDYLTKMGTKTVPQPPYCRDLAPRNFWLFSNITGWDNWGNERGCDEGHWHAHTRGLLWGLPEVVGTVQQVHCNRRRLLRSGGQGFMCVLPIKVPIRKKGCKLILCTS